MAVPVSLYVYWQTSAVSLLLLLLTLIPFMLGVDIVKVFLYTYPLRELTHILLWLLMTGGSIYGTYVVTGEWWQAASAGALVVLFLRIPLHTVLFHRAEDQTFAKAKYEQLLRDQIRKDMEDRSDRGKH